MMERKVICDLNLISVDFGREEERQPGNTFRMHSQAINAGGNEGVGPGQDGFPVWS
jgi:hypothetical protein